MTIGPERSSGPLPEWVRRKLEASTSTLWVGALSFEPRCTASLLRLQHAGVRLDTVLLLDYPTTVTPRNDDRRLRAENRDAVERIRARGHIRKVISAASPARAHAFDDLSVQLDSALRDENVSLLIADVSCLTKVHTIALAAAMKTRASALQWVVGYTTPQNYGDLDALSRSRGWRDIVVGPIAEHAFLLNEQYSRGVVLTGHESDRLIVGLGELRASGGSILYADTPNRPDLSLIATRKNQRGLSQLDRSAPDHWRTIHYEISDTNLIARLVSAEADVARAKKAPVILYPYGPKIAVFAAALTLMDKYPEGSWFVCPTPWGYTIKHSEGIERTYWFSKSA